MCYDLALAPGAESMSEEQKPFTVKDRRHFTLDGQAREAQETAEEKPAEEAAPTQAPVPEGEAPRGGAATKKAAHSASGSPAPEPVDFGHFLLSLGAQADLLLAGRHEGESPAQALSEARSIISILEMLKDKSEGRRTADEERILEDLLYQLRMAYVARARETGE